MDERGVHQASGCPAGTGTEPVTRAPLALSIVRRLRLRRTAGATPVILSSPEMLTGKRFRLKTDTMGIGTVDDKRVAVTVPADAIIEVTGGPRPNDMRMVD